MEHIERPMAFAASPGRLNRVTEYVGTQTLSTPHPPVAIAAGGSGSTGVRGEPGVGAAERADDPCHNGRLNSV